MPKGGARPGAGRKKKAETESQETMRELVRSVVTEADMKAVTTAAVTLAKSGDPASRQWLSSYVLGNPKTEHDVNHKGSIDHRLREVPDDALKQMLEAAAESE